MKIRYFLPNLRDNWSRIICRAGISSWVTVLSISIICALSANFYFRENNFAFAINMDGQGYYAYLPFLIESGATSYDNFLEFTPEPDTIPHFLRRTPQGLVNKFYVGEALLLSPFYFAGRIFSDPTAPPGYSRACLLSLIVGSLFYFGCGLILFRKILISLQFREWTVALVIIALVAMTNLEWYVYKEPSMAHVYLFLLVCATIYALIRYEQKKSNASLLLVFTLFGLIALTRPTDLLLALFIPFFISWNSVVRSLLFWKGWLVFATVISIQFILYYVQSGSWMVWSYDGEYFDFSHPHIALTWFGTVKGLAVYFPVLLLSIAGLIVMYRQSRKKFGVLVLPFIAVFYVLSSWHAWEYGWSFGMRGYIQYYPLLMIPVAVWIEWCFRRKSSVIILLTFLTYCAAHTRSARTIATVSYPFIQEISAEEWGALLFHNKENISSKMKALEAKRPAE
jgi:hypothetical protein